MSAPSYSSFPTFTSFPDLDPGPSTRPASTEVKDKDKNRHRHKKSHKEEDREGNIDKERKKKKKDKHERHREGEESKGARRRSRSRSLARTKEPSYGGVEDERKKREEDLRHRQDDGEKFNTKGLVYYTDRKGDPLNVRYGGLHEGDIPRYRLVDRRKVLGLSPALSVVYRGRGGTEIAPFGRRKMPALTDSHSRHLLSAPPKRRLLASAENKYKYDEVDGFLRISTNRPRKDDQSYREIELSKQDYDSDESEASQDSASSDSDSDTTPTTSLQSTLKALEERLAANPQDIPGWLSLLSHTLSTVPISSKNAPRTRAEIALALLGRALTAHPNNARSLKLRLKYLRAGEELWKRDVLTEEWDAAVEVDDVEIWLAWLDWAARNTSDILETIVEDAGRVYRALASRGDEVGQLRALWRVAVALKEAGYIERANALMQAQAELLFAVPQRIAGRPFEERLDALEEFWDSEVPRIGEQGAKGWAEWEASNHAAQAPPPPPQSTTLDPQIADPYSRWAAAETLADGTGAMPLRTNDGDDDADPYAFVLLSDIRPLLLSLRTDRAKDVFRRIWLAFAGLQVPGFVSSLSSRPDDNADDRWACSDLVSSSRLASVFPASDGVSVKRITADAQAGVLIGHEREYSSGFGPVKSWGYEAIAPLESVGSNRWTMWTSEDVHGLDLGLIREIFRQCRIPGDDADWDVLNLAFEAAVSIKSALKVSKTLLASARDSLPHWAAHARLECLRGRLDDARKVYQTVLIAASQRRPGEGALWWDWALMEWLAREEDVAMQVIIRSSGVAGSGGIATLRAKRHFETLLTQQQLGASWKEREPWIKISVLLELLTSSPQAAIALIDSYLNALPFGTPGHESLTVASLALLYNHAVVLRNPTPPALLRERVEQAVEAYPNNTAILGIFLEAEKGQGIWGRVRTMLGETVADGTGGKEKSVARRVAEVWVAGWEKGRWEAEVERTRSGLTAAVEDDRTRGSAALWKLFIAFEMRAGQPGRAKKLLFRAVGECPLVKELYLMAFGPLRGEFSARELQRFGDAMAERRLRMRVGLDEVAGEWAQETGGAGWKAEDGQAEDEIERNARDYRRLLPY